MAFDKKDLKNLYKNAANKLFREAVFSKHPDVEKSLSSLIDKEKGLAAMSRFMGRFNHPRRAPTDLQKATLIAYLEHQLLKYYSIHKQSKSYLDEFINKSSDENTMEYAIAHCLKKEDKSSILYNAASGILLSAGTGTVAYDQDSAEKAINKLLHSSDDTFEVKKEEKLSDEKKSAHSSNFFKSDVTTEEESDTDKSLEDSAPTTPKFS